MLKQLWATGILAAFSVFGIKAGLGLGARLFHNGISSRRKLLFAAISFFVYFLLFFSMHCLISGFQLTEYLDRLIEMLQYGMLLHFTVAVGLLLWGARLLLVKSGKVLPSKGSLLLIVPCPVCATVILLNLSLAGALFDLPLTLTTLLLFGLFLGIITATLGVMLIFRRRIQSTETFLGLSMAVVALYFLFTVMIAPIYPEIEAAFNMAASNSPNGQIEKGPLIILATTAFIFGVAGFLRVYFNIGEKR